MENIKKYDLTVLLKEEDASSVMALLDKNGATNVKADKVEEIKLAYEVEGLNSAFMAVFKFDLSSENVDKLEKELKMLSQALRFLILKDEKEEKPSSETPREKTKEIKRKPKEEKTKKESDLLTNEAIEKKIEEIMN